MCQYAAQGNSLEELKEQSKKKKLTLSSTLCHKV